MNKCSCIQDENFNFTIDYRGDHLIYTDYSTWVTSDKMKPITEYSLKILNQEISKTLSVKVGSSTIIKYSDLPTSCTGCNPDGVYTFELRICDDIYQRTEAILISAMCSYDTLLQRDDWGNALEVFKYMEFVKSAARLDQPLKAQEYYSNLLKFIKKLNCNCNAYM